MIGFQGKHTFSQGIGEDKNTCSVNIKKRLN